MIRLIKQIIFISVICIIAATFVPSPFRKGGAGTHYYFYLAVLTYLVCCFYLIISGVSSKLEGLVCAVPVSFMALVAGWSLTENILLMLYGEYEMYLDQYIANIIFFMVINYIAGALAFGVVAFKQKIIKKPLRQ